MPVCRLCLRVQPSAEVRPTRLGYVCKNKWFCNNRQIAIQQHAKHQSIAVSAQLPYDASEAYDLGDPKHPDYAEAGLDYADMSRKREKGE